MQIAIGDNRDIPCIYHWPSSFAFFDGCDPFFQPGLFICDRASATCEGKIILDIYDPW